LGTDKNVGGGKFEVDRNTERVDFDFVESANASMLLSLYIPTEQEVGMLNLPESRYELVIRGGYMAGSDEEDFKHLRKKSVYAFSVGSIFPTTTKLSGKIVDLKPSWNDERMHPVYRSGKPFFVPIKVNEL
jgi:CRISPR type III-A-associated RAMP protein Csm4